MLAALEPQLGVVRAARATPIFTQPVLDLEHHAARLRSGGLNAKPSALPSRGSRPTRSILSSRFWRDCACRARVPARKRVTKRSSARSPASWRSIARPERQLALRLLEPPRVPGALEVASHGRPRARGPPCPPPPGTSGHARPARRRVERLQVRLEPLQRRDVEVVGRLVEQQQVGIAGERARQRRARELAAGERRQRAVEVLVAEAEAVQRRVDRLAPVVAAGVLQPRLRGRVGVQRGAVDGAVGHRLLERRQPLLERQQLAAAGQHVVAQRQGAIARRPLVVQRELDVLGERELAAVDPALAGQHPQQRRLARAVAPGQGQPVAPLELERDAAQQGLARHVLGEV